MIVIRYGTRFAYYTSVCCQYKSSNPHWILTSATFGLWLLPHSTPSIPLFSSCHNERSAFWRLRSSADDSWCCLLVTMSTSQDELGCGSHSGFCAMPYQPEPWAYARTNSGMLHVYDSTAQREESKILEMWWCRREMSWAVLPPLDVPTPWCWRFGPSGVMTKLAWMRSAPRLLDSLLLRLEVWRRLYIYLRMEQADVRGSAL